MNVFTTPGQGRASSGIAEWSVGEAAQYIRVPGPNDDKYRHGVLGIATGSTAFPGAAVLGVDAAHATGVGMVRFIGEKSVELQVLHRRPETVTGEGQVHAWLLGSGTGWAVPGTQSAVVNRALVSGLPLVLDAGALPLADLATGLTILTPHHQECARLMACDPREVDEDPLGSAARLADQFTAIVVLKGHVTFIVSPEHDGNRSSRQVSAPTTWLATAGTGDVLAGIMGALVATHATQTTLDRGTLAGLAATAVFVHGAAALRAGSGGPFGASDIARHLGSVIAGILENRGA
ncbi:MAG: NAD(P)H-hydrate dehydratase [Actinobacteria bacterium]|uniref:Unannotated protein n=1 Tax=freshwater metagenome TaxID=449393 RepID=A0A6J7G1E8_9ZZZZ|nr:NAD(P)H-hydrate dehydratase [Actinomycetota bacterium]